MKIAIIGTAGVGKAHLVAALNLGLKVDTFDLKGVPPPFTINNGIIHVRNEWGPLCDEFVGLGSSINHTEINHDPEDTLRILGSHDAIIVATPTHTHKHYQKAFQTLKRKQPFRFKAAFMLEKPAFSLSQLDDTQPLNVGYEWLYHPQIHTNLPTLDGKHYRYSLSFVHSYAHSSENPIEDLAPHLVSIAVYQFYLSLIRDGKVRAGYKHLGGYVKNLTYRIKPDGYKAKLILSYLIYNLEVDLQVGYVETGGHFGPVITTDHQTMVDDTDVFLLQLSALLFRPMCPQHKIARSLWPERICKDWYDEV